LPLGLIGEQLNAKAAELEGIQFDSDGDDPDTTIQAVDFNHRHRHLIQTQLETMDRSLNSLIPIFRSGVPGGVGCRSR
jgi:hypothetical protein